MSCRDIHGLHEHFNGSVVDAMGIPMESIECSWIPWLRLHNPWDPLVPTDSPFGSSKEALSASDGELLGNAHVSVVARATLPLPEVICILHTGEISIVFCMRL